MLKSFQAREICVGDEVEFTTIQDPGYSLANNKQSAIRIKHLPPGKVQFETLMENNVEGELRGDLSYGRIVIYFLHFLV